MNRVFTAPALGFGHPYTSRVTRAFTSARRWERHGILGTTLRTWRVMALYAAGRSPERLADLYEAGDREERARDAP